jgi:hypothetical protein
MSLEAIAEEIIVLEEPTLHMHSDLEHEHGHLSPMQHDHDHGHGLPMQHMQHMHDDMHGGGHLLIEEPEIEIIVQPLDGIPGAGLEHDLPALVVEEEDSEAEKSDKDDKKSTSDENDAKKAPKKHEKWDWESKGATGFISWIKERIDDVPKHSGMDTSGLERAISYLEKLDSEISKAMRLDLDGDLDANKIEEVRSKIDDGLSRLHDRLDKVKKTKKKYKNKKADLDLEPIGFVKEAQKITGVRGIYVTVPLLISRIARVCINGMVSAGHDIEDLYDRQVKLYKLNTREKAEVMQLLSDMGYPLRQDRGFMPEDALEVSDSNGMDWASNYKG